MYQFSRAQKDIIEYAQMLTIEQIEQEANERNRKGIFPIKLLGLLGSIGITTMSLGKEYGCAPIDTVSSMAILENIAYSDSALAHMLATINYGYLLPITHFGSERQKQDLKEFISSGIIATMAYTESEKDMQTIAVESDDKFVLHGQKCMVTGGPYAQKTLVYAKTEAGLSAFILDLENSPGIERGERDETMGLNSLHICDIYFRGTPIRKESLLSSQGDGMQILSKSMEYMRLSNAAISLGIAKRAHAEAASYSKVRKYQSKPLFEQQIIQYTLAEMQAELEVMEAAVYTCAKHADSALVEKGQLYYSSCSKLVVVDLSQKICDKSLQIFGGSGYFKGITIERLYRDIRVMSIIGGISDMLKWSIARDI